jgi:hypothetical protein
MGEDVPVFLSLAQGVARRPHEPPAFLTLASKGEYTARGNIRRAHAEVLGHELKFDDGNTSSRESTQRSFSHFGNTVTHEDFDTPRSQSTWEPVVYAETVEKERPGRLRRDGSSAMPSSGARRLSNNLLRTVVKKARKPAAKEVELLPLQVVGAEELELESWELIGRGETGGVFRASSDSLNIQRGEEDKLPVVVAVRRLDDIGYKHYVTNQDLEDEVQRLASLRHRNLLQVVAFAAG